MALLNLATARQKLWQYGPHKVPFPGTQAQRDDFDAALNSVVEEFLLGGKWRNTMRRVRIPIYDGRITLPRELQTCEGVKLIPTEENLHYEQPLLIYGKFHEFHNGPVPGWECCRSGAFPDTQQAQTFITPDAGFTLRIVSTEAKGALQLIGGTDADDVEYFEPTSMNIVNGTTNNARVYNTLPLIQKPVTNVPVYLYAVNNGTATLIAIYAPGETIPAYTRYIVTREDDTDHPACWCLCKLAYVEAVADTDIIYPGVGRALIQGLLAIEREVAREQDAADKLWAKAAAILDRDRQQIDGDTFTEFPVLDNTAFAGGLGVL